MYIPSRGTFKVFQIVSTSITIRETFWWKIVARGCGCEDIHDTKIWSTLIHLTVVYTIMIHILNNLYGKLSIICVLFYYFFLLVRLVLYMYMFYTRLWIKNDIIIFHLTSINHTLWVSNCACEAFPKYKAPLVQILYHHQTIKEPILDIPKSLLHNHTLTIPIDGQRDTWDLRVVNGHPCDPLACCKSCIIRSLWHLHDWGMMGWIMLMSCGRKCENYPPPPPPPPNLAHPRKSLSYHPTIPLSQLTLKVLNFWKFTSYCSLKTLWSGMGEVVPARTSPTLMTSPIPSHCASIIATSTVRVNPYLSPECNISGI